MDETGNGKGRCSIRQKTGVVTPAKDLSLTVTVVGDKAAPVTVLRTSAPGNSYVRFLSSEHSRGQASWLLCRYSDNAVCSHSGLHITQA